MSVEHSKQKQRCPIDNSVLKRTPKSPSSKITETLDSGAQPRRVERLAEAESIFKERSKEKPKPEVVIPNKHGKGPSKGNST